MDDSALTTFNYLNEVVRTVLIDGEPWFVAKDVFDVLGITNAAQALQQLDYDEKGLCKIYTFGGTQQLSIISEPGLYKLTIRSNKPDAKPFLRWMVHDVVPAIRKTGQFGQVRSPLKPKPSASPLDKVERAERLELKIEHDQPLVDSPQAHLIVRPVQSRALLPTRSV